MSESSPFLSLLLITGLAAFVPLLASKLRRLRLPTVVGEILAGMFIGKSGLNLIETSPTLDFLALFGFTYLMFLSGLEVDFGSLSSDSEDEDSPSRLRRSVLLGSLVFLISLVISYTSAGALLYFDLITDPLMVALILSTTSLGIVVPVLKERALIASDLGQTVLFSALIADFGTLLLITVDVAILSHGFTPDVLFVLLFLVVFALLFRLAKVAVGLSSLRKVFDELAHATSQIHVRGAVAVMVAFIVLSEWLGLEVILGAFLAGVLISLLSREDRTQFLRLKMDAIGFGFFIPIFFIMVGVRFDLGAIIQSPRTLLLVPLLLLIAYFIKLAAALPYRAFFPWRETFAAGVLLSSRLSLIIAAAAIATELGLLDDAVNSAIILVAVVTCTVSPVLFNRILPPREGRGGRKGIILVGLGEIPVLMAERLHKAGKAVTLVGTDQTQVQRLRKRKLKVVKGDPGLLRTLRRAGADTAELLIAVSTYDEVNLAACRHAYETFGIPSLIAQAGDTVTAEEMSEMGVRVVQPQMATALALEGALYFPAVFDILADAADGIEIAEVTLRNPDFTGKLVRNIRLPGDALVMGIRRKKEILVPRGDTKLRLGDLIMLAGKGESLKRSILTLSREPKSAQPPVGGAS
jgi:Kef-type K+ transport system membrane component KefB/Trk K+ transport system NAD-binding subunit